MESATQFKDRLVEYDRQAAKRTHVVDDQSDFYAVDSNAWLTAEVGHAASQAKHSSSVMVCCCKNLLSCSREISRCCCGDVAAYKGCGHCSVQAVPGSLALRGSVRRHDT